MAVIEGGGAGTRTNTTQYTAVNITPNPTVSAVDAYLSAYLAGLAGVSPGTSGDGGAAARDVARRQLDIQERKLIFQQETGLRDIETAREKGLRGAINNALQRGIYRSGIRIENEGEVMEEADNAKSDLMKQIEFALESLQLSREGISASAKSAGTPATGHPWGISPEEAQGNAAIIGSIESEGPDQPNRVIGTRPVPYRTRDVR